MPTIRYSTIAALGMLCVVSIPAWGDEPGERRVGLPIQITQGAGREAAATSEPSGHVPIPISPPTRSMPGDSKTAPRSTTGSVTTVLGSLAMVLGLFFLVVAMARRSAPKGSALLPAEAVELLGRRALAGRHHLHVVRFGNKLVLLSVTAAGAESLAEITDTVEVDRIAGLCQQQQPGSISTSFRHLMNQMGRERTTDTFVSGEEDAPYDDMDLHHGLEGTS